MFKLEQNGIFGNLRIILQDHTGLDKRKGRVVLNGQVFHGAVLQQEFPRFNLDPMYFFICVNDLLEGLHSWSFPLFKGRMRFPKIKKKGGEGAEIFYKNGGWQGGIQYNGGCLIFLLS